MSAEQVPVIFVFELSSSRSLDVPSHPSAEFILDKPFVRTVFTNCWTSAPTILSISSASSNCLKLVPSVCSSWLSMTVPGVFMSLYFVQVWFSLDLSFLSVWSVYSRPGPASDGAEVFVAYCSHVLHDRKPLPQSSFLTSKSFFCCILF